MGALGQSPDLSLPEIEGTPPLLTRLLNGYVDRVLTAAEYDPVAVDSFFSVTALVDPATRLLRPKMLWRAALAKHRRRRIDQQPGGSGMPSSASTLRSRVG